MHRIKERLSDTRWLWKYKRAKHLFDAAIPNRYYLPESNFSDFVDKYGSVETKPFQDYSEEGMESRARERAAFLHSLGRQKEIRALEIGAADGLVLRELLACGASEAVAVDIVDQLHPKAKEAGVQLALASAEDLSVLSPHSFDLIYSWGSLEHIPDAKKAVEECLRLLKPGGTLYLEAGPLSCSPWGYHYYATLKVPYINLLFPESLLHDYARTKHGEGFSDFLPWTNGKPASDYLALLKGLPPDIVIGGLWHGFDWFSSDMISRYPDVFKAKGINFNDFFIDGIRLTLKRKPCF